MWMVKRLIALQGDWVTVPGTYEILQVPKGHCWVEGDNGEISLDSKSFGPVSALTKPWIAELAGECMIHWLLIWYESVCVMQIPLGLMKGRVTHVVWPPSRFGRVPSHLPEGRVLSQKTGPRTYP
jgi:inner membrane protease subunit 2